MSTYDEYRYGQLMASTTFNAEFYKGTWNDQSVNKLAMTTTGTPRWALVNSFPTLNQYTGNVVRSSALIPTPINVTQPFWVELLCAGVTGDYLFYHVNAGGFTVYYQVSSIQIFTYTAVPANARWISGTIPSKSQQLFHAVGYMDATGLTGKWWYNGSPVTSVFTNTAPNVVGGNTNLYMGSIGAASPSKYVLARIWQGTPTDDDARCLYQAAHSLGIGV